MFAWKTLNDSGTGEMRSQCHVEAWSGALPIAGEDVQLQALVGDHQLAQGCRILSCQA